MGSAILYVYTPHNNIIITTGIRRRLRHAVTILITCGRDSPVPIQRHAVRPRAYHLFCLNFYGIIT